MEKGKICEGCGKPMENCSCGCGCCCGGHSHAKPEKKGKKK